MFWCTSFDHSRKLYCRFEGNAVEISNEVQSMQQQVRVLASEKGDLANQLHSEQTRCRQHHAQVCLARPRLTSPTSLDIPLPVCLPSFMHPHAGLSVMLLFPAHVSDGSTTQGLNILLFEVVNYCAEERMSLSGSLPLSVIHETSLQSVCHVPDVLKRCPCTVTAFSNRHVQQ